MLKKLLTLIISLFCICTATVCAKSALYSDIDTYINHYPINAYSVDGKMVVVAEDLRDYGFNVDWREATRSLHISRNENAKKLTKKDVYDPKYASGTKYMDIYSSDIKVFYNNTQLESFSLNGRTLITLNDFAALVGHGDWLENIRAYKVWIDGLSVCDYEPLKKRCINLWYQTSYDIDMPTIRYAEDMDGDGVKEDIKISIDGVDEYDWIIATLTIDDAKLQVANESFSITAVYFADIIPNDNMKELLVFSSSENGWEFMEILRYSNGNIQKLQHSYIYDDSYELSPGINVGTYKPYIDLNEDGSFTAYERTNSLGMWHVYSRYFINSQGMLEHIPQDIYTVVPNSGIPLDSQGYYYVKKPLITSGIKLYQGDWIKPIEDDMKGNIKIQKSNGETGWLYISSHGSDDASDYYQLVEWSDMFAMAG